MLVPVFAERYPGASGIGYGIDNVSPGNVTHTPTDIAFGIERLGQRMRLRFIGLDLQIAHGTVFPDTRLARGGIDHNARTTPDAFCARRNS